jgi:hypothetical protein
MQEPEAHWLSARQRPPATPVPTAGSVGAGSVLNRQARVPFQFAQVAPLGQSALVLHFLTQVPAILPPTVENWPGPVPVTSPETCARSSVRPLSVQQMPPTPQMLSALSLLQATLQKPGDVPLARQRLLRQPLALVADGVQSA